MAEIGEIVNYIVRGGGAGAEALKETIAFGTAQAKEKGERFDIKKWLLDFHGKIRKRLEEREGARPVEDARAATDLDAEAMEYLSNAVKFSATEEGRALMRAQGVDGATTFLVEKGYESVPGIGVLEEAGVVETSSAEPPPSRAGATSWGRMRQTPARDMTTIEDIPGLGTSTLRADGGFSPTVAEDGTITTGIGLVPGTVGYEGSVSQTLTEARPEEGELGAPTSRSMMLGAAVPGIAEGTPSDFRRESPVFAGGDIDDIWEDGVKPEDPKPRTAEDEAAIAKALGEEVALSDIVSSLADATGVNPGSAVDEGPGDALGNGPDAGLIGTGTQGEGAPPSGGLSGMSLASGIVGGVGIASAIANTITDFRTTAALEEMLADSAAGNTVAREEGQLMGGQLQRNIMASSMGRRDISPALALRNAQQAVAPALSDTYAQAAIESARERRQSETQLAQLRKQRYDSLFGSLMQTAGTVGSMLATQGANQETEAMAKRVEALERRGLQDVTGGRRRG